MRIAGCRSARVKEICNRSPMSAFRSLLVVLVCVCKRADDVGHALDARCRQRRRQRVEHFHRRRWIVEVHGADLNRRCAGDEELHHVVDRGDAADADDRRFDGLGRLIHGPQGDRLDRRAAEAAHDVAQHRPAASPVDRHAEARVDQRDRVGPAGRGRLGDRRRCWSRSASAWR